MMRGLFVCFIGILLLQQDAIARRFYISRTGNDANTFTQAQNQATPWASLAKVNTSFSSFLPGDTISFRCGESFSGNLIINRSGLSTNPIVINSYGVGAKPKFTGNGTTLNHLFYAFGRSWLVFDGLEIIDPNLTADTARTQLSKIRRAVTLDSCFHSVVKNCAISLVGTGVYISRGGYNTVSNNTISNLRMIVNTNDGNQPGNNDDYGANSITLNSSNNTITRNTCTGAWAQSFDYGWDGGGIEMYDEGFGVRKNTISYNTFNDCHGIFEVKGVCDSNAVFYNQFINNHSITYVHSTCKGWTFFNNIVIQTQYTRSAGQFLIGARAGALFGLTMRNNVFLVNTGAAMANTERIVPFIHTNNYFKLNNGSITNFILSTAESLGNASLFTDSSSFNPINWNLRPLFNSPLINRGISVGISKDFAGVNVSNPPEIGLYESTSTTPAPLDATVQFGSISCFGGSTVATVTATGGTMPYTGTGTFTVTAGSYSYIVTDASGIRDTVLATITQPTALSGTVSTGTITEYGGTTTATATASGGTAPYSYALNGGAFQSSNQFANLPAGTDTIQIRDARNCTLSRIVNIMQPASTLTVTGTATKINCFGGTAQITISASGGKPPYQGVGTFTVSAGTHTYSVTDSFGVVRSTTISVSQPPAIQLNVSAGRILVNGGNTSITASASGGSGRLATWNYRLNAGSFQASSVFTGVPAGTHTVTTRDSLGCLSTISLTLIQPNPLVAISRIASHVPCSGGLATISISANGGIAPYTGIGNFQVSPGTYTYTVRDSAGVSRTTTITVTQPADLSATVTAGTITTYGGATSITVNNVTGGISPYTYALNNGSYQSSNVFSNVAAGTDTVFIKDSRGCIINRTITIRQPVKALILNYNHHTCRWVWNGSITLGADGGTPPYRYKIDNYGFGSANYFYNLGPYTFRLAVRDAIGDSSVILFTILPSNNICSRSNQSTDSLRFDMITNDNDPTVQVFPNPSTQGFTITQLPISDGTLIQLMDSKGSTVYTNNIRQGVRATNIPSSLPPGLYWLSIRTRDKVISKRLIKQ